MGPPLITPLVIRGVADLVLITEYSLQIIRRKNLQTISTSYQRHELIA
jgi:hypothetical protein